MKSFSRFTAAVASFAAFGALAGPVPTHYYNFDAGSGTVAVDTGSVGGANATLSAATWSTNTPFAYSGNNALTTTTTAVQAPGFTLGLQSTISVWAYWGGATSTPQYVLDSTNNATRTLIYFVDSNNPTLVAFGGNFFSGVLTQPTTPGWQNVVLARNGTALNIYQNGVFNATRTVGNAAYSIPTWYFGQRFAGTERFAGQIDEFAFFNQTLDASQVRTLYTQGTATLIVPEPGTLALIALAGSLMLAQRRRAPRS